MASAKFEREYGQHLVEQVLKGQDDEAPAAGARVGLRLLADRRRPAAGGLRRRRHRHHRVAERDRRARARHGRHAQVDRPAADHRSRPGHHLRPGRHRPRLPVPRVPHRPQQRQLAARPSSPRAGRRTTRVDVWTFKLRQGVTFNDGSPFEAEDVVTSMERVLDPDSGSGALVAAQRRPLAEGHQGRRRPHRRVQPRQAVRRLPVHGVRPATTTPPSCRATTRATSSRTRSAPAPSCSSSTRPSRRPRSRRTPPTGARTSRATSCRTWTGHRVRHGRGQLGRRTCSCSPAPSTSSRRRCSRARRRCSSDPNLRVDIYPGTGIREVAFNTTSEPWKAPTPSSSARPSPTASTARPSTRRCTTAAATSATTPSGSRRCSPAARRARGARPGLREGQAAARRRRLRRRLEIELTFAKYLENPQLAQLIQEQCKPAGINVKINQISYDAFYAGGDADYYGTTPWLNAPMTIVEWGSRPDAGRLRRRPCSCPTPSWSSSHWDNTDFAHTFDQYMATTDEAHAHGAGAPSCRRSSRTTRRSWCRSSSRSCARRRRTCTASRAPARSTAICSAGLHDRVRQTNGYGRLRLT